MEAVPGPRGPAGQPGIGKDADCAAVMAQLDLLIARVEALERKLTPDASGQMTGLPPMGVTYRDDATGEEMSVHVYLGDGFRTAPPRQLTPSLRGEDK